MFPHPFPVLINSATPTYSTLDANEAVARVAYQCSELFAIYPITPSSPMGESVDEWSCEGQQNLWGHVPEVIQLQSEAGAAGTLHGALQAGTRACSFTASQGLLLMIPNLYKIAGELHPFVLHVTARSLATHALSIFCDHGDVMACRQTGAALLCANSVQEAQDFAAVAHAATLTTRVPFLHFFDGFRTSHEIQKIALLSEDDLNALVQEDDVSQARARGLTPDHPAIRGTAQNPDVFFQAREAANPFYDAVPERVQAAFDVLADRTGRQYHIFDYEGHPAADRVIIVMGSGTETCMETSAWLNAQGERTGVLTVRLYRPFDANVLLAALPASVRKIAVLDRTKEPGASGEPLFLDVIAAVAESDRAGQIKVTGGRYGLGSKEFTPGMAQAVFQDLAETAPKRRFTVGIYDDITHLSLPFSTELDIESVDTRRAVFFGLGSDGTVGANKNSIKIIGESTDLQAQGFFVYDSKKAGAMTVSHLRFGPQAIRAPYLIGQADFVACHYFPFLEKVDVLGVARPGGTLLLNTPGGTAKVWSQLPLKVQRQIIELQLKVYAIDAASVANEAGMRGRTNTVMQTCFFALSGVLPKDDAIGHIKTAIRKTYGKKGEAIVARNEAAVDAALAGLVAVEVPAETNAPDIFHPLVPPNASDFGQRVTARMLAGEGDLLPVSAFPPDGTWPVGSTKWEKRNLAPEIPVWDPSICIQCNKCVLVCPHAAIRPAAFPEALAADAPETFKHTALRSPDIKDHRYVLQVAAEDCTGCTLCHEVCPAKDRSQLGRKALMMQPQEPLVAAERVNWDFFLNLPPAPAALQRADVKGSQFREPLFEFSGACVGCGETPYLKVLTQLFGDRLIMANATGCSSIYGGNLPTTPYCTDKDGRGPAWSNSLFEDNAEYGLGLRTGVDQFVVQARHLVGDLAPTLPVDLVERLSIMPDDQQDETIAARRADVTLLRSLLADSADPKARRLLTLADYLVPKSVWIVGGDGWAYDIGSGGLDHVLSTGRNVNVLVLDTEVYSNTGGQRSKATPMGAVAKFSAGGKDTDKKDLALMATSYGHIYVARIAMGAKDSQTVQAIHEAESYPGPSLIIAYSHCIAHGISMAGGLNQQKLAVQSGHWPLFRYDPRRAERGLGTAVLDSPPPKIPLRDYTRNELRFQLLARSQPERAAELAARAQIAADQRQARYQAFVESTQPPASETP